MHQNLEGKLKTVKDVSEPILGLKVSRTYDLIRRGILPAGVVVRISKRQIRINERKLCEWIDQGGIQPSYGGVE